MTLADLLHRLAQLPASRPRPLMARDGTGTMVPVLVKVEVHRPGHRPEVLEVTGFHLTAYQPASGEPGALVLTCDGGK